MSVTSYSDNNIWFLLQKIQFVGFRGDSASPFRKGTWGKNRKHTAMHGLLRVVQFGITKITEAWLPWWKEIKRSLNKFKSLIYRQLCVRCDPCWATLDFISSGAAQSEAMFRSLSSFKEVFSEICYSWPSSLNFLLFCNLLIVWSFVKIAGTINYLRVKCQKRSDNHFR